MKEEKFHQFHQFQYLVSQVFSFNDEKDLQLGIGEGFGLWLDRED